MGNIYLKTRKRIR